jgi:hypothetical protein
MCICDLRARAKFMVAVALLSSLRNYMHLISKDSIANERQDPKSLHSPRNAVSKVTSYRPPICPLGNGLIHEHAVLTPMEIAPMVQIALL